MNTEIFDYFKTLSKKGFFFVNVINTICSVVIILAGFISLRQGTSLLTYLIMFGCATVILGLNSYKCFKRKSKNGIIFAIIGVVFAAVTGLLLYTLIRGGN